MKAKPRGVIAKTTGKLIALRKEQNLTLKQMCDNLGLKRGSYTRYENGQAIPGLHTLNMIVDKYGLSIDWLLFDREPKYIMDRSRLEELEKEVEQLKTSLDSQRKDSDARLEEKDKKIDDLEQQLNQKETKMLEVLNKTGIADLLDMVEKDAVLYHKLMLYVEDYKMQKAKTEAP